MTKEQRKHTKDEIQKLGGYQNYILKYDKLLINKKFLKNITNENKMKNRIEENYIQSNNCVEGNFIRITNRFKEDGSVHSMLYIHKPVVMQGYAKNIWFVDDTTGVTKYSKRLLVIVCKNEFGYRQIIAWSFLFDGSKE